MTTQTLCSCTQPLLRSPTCVLPSRSRSSAAATTASTPACSGWSSSSSLCRRLPRDNSRQSLRCRKLQKLSPQAGIFGLGLPEVAVITGVAVLIFGPSKLPELGKELGKSVKSFQSAAKEFENELKDASKDDDKAPLDDKK